MTIQTCGVSYVVTAQSAFITGKQLLSGVRDDMAVKPAPLPKLEVAVRTAEQSASVCYPHVLFDHPPRLELSAALRAVPRLCQVRIPLVTAQRRPAAVASPALVTHVRLVSAMRLHVNAQQVRSEERLGADRATVIPLAHDAAVVLPHVTLQRVLPQELLATHAAVVPQLLGVDPHVDAEV